MSRLGVIIKDKPYLVDVPFHKNGELAIPIKLKLISSFLVDFSAGQVLKNRHKSIYEAYRILNDGTQITFEELKALEETI